jgi:hypothetical protein
MKKNRLTKEQIEMLLMSEEDIKADRFISQKELDKSDKKFLKQLKPKKKK